MLNQKHNVFKGQKSKSKIFITILCIFGLLFSWSCSCKNKVTGPGNDGLENGRPGPITDNKGETNEFKMSAATDNVTDNFIVKSASTVGEIKIAFVSANNYAYTSSYEVVDNDTTEANRITTAEKTITINFTFKANDASLKNNTQTLSVEVKLTKAQEVKDDNIENILKKMDGVINYSEGEYDAKKSLTFSLSKGSYDNTTKVYTIKNTTQATKIFDTFPEGAIKECKGHASFYLKKLAETTDDELTPTNEEGGLNESYLTLTYNVKWSDNFESTITEIKIKFDLNKN